MSVSSSSSLLSTDETVLIVPGIGNSGPEHWQTHWERQSSNCIRVTQRDWERPICAEWLVQLERAVRHVRPAPLVVAHSLGCLLVAHWLSQTQQAIGGALLVAIPNPEGPQFPDAAIGFAPVPQKALPCPSIVVASTNDPYADLQFAQDCANRWGSRFVNIGNAGHINAASGLDQWHQGQTLLRNLKVDRVAIPSSD